MTVCQHYLCCWESSHAAEFSSQRRWEYSPTCKLLKCSPVIVCGMNISMRKHSFRTHLQSWCVLPAKQGTAFTTDNLHHGEVAFQFPGKALLRWRYCRREADPLISAIPASSCLSCSPSSEAPSSLRPSSHVQRKHNSPAKPDPGWTLNTDKTPLWVTS